MLAFRGLWSVSKGRSAFDRHRALVIITFLTFAFFFPSHKAPYHVLKLTLKSSRILFVD